MVSGCQQTIRYATGMREGPIVLLGDSLAAGYGVKPQEGFVSILESRLKVRITNLSTPGLTTKEGLPKIASNVLPLAPALVLIELGGNDILQRIDPQVTEANLTSMIQQLHEHDIPVILLGIQGGLGQDLSPVYKKLSARFQTGYVPHILKGILSRPALKIDSVHPNAQGHLVLADRIEPELQRVLALIGRVR